MARKSCAEMLAAERSRVRKLRADLMRVLGERDLMAMLAAETPQFYNPLAVAEAKRLRDTILAARLSSGHDTTGRPG